MKMYEVEEDYVGRDLSDPSIRQSRGARTHPKVIEAYRDPAAVGR